LENPWCENLVKMRRAKSAPGGEKKRNYTPDNRITEKLLIVTQLLSL